MKTGDMLVNSERQTWDRDLVHTVLIVTLAAAAAVAFWFFTPVHDVTARIHQIAQGY